MLVQYLSLSYKSGVHDKALFRVRCMCRKTFPTHSGVSAEWGGPREEGKEVLKNVYNKSHPAFQAPLRRRGRFAGVCLG